LILPGTGEIGSDSSVDGGARVRWNGYRRFSWFRFPWIFYVPLEKYEDLWGMNNVVGRDIDRFPKVEAIQNSQQPHRACHTIMVGFRPHLVTSHFKLWLRTIMHSFTSPTVKTQEAKIKGLGGVEVTDAGATYVLEN